MSKGRKGLKPLPANTRNIMAVGEYVEQKEEYKNHHAKILPSGEMQIKLHGHWVSKNEFDALIKEPFVPDFKANKNNVDRTGVWMY